MARALPPASSTSRATLWMVPGSLGWGWADFAARTRLAPSLAQRRAIARPMPRLAPVMMMVLFCSVALFMSISSLVVVFDSYGLVVPLSEGPRRRPLPRQGTRVSQALGSPGACGACLDSAVCLVFDVNLNQQLANLNLITGFHVDGLHNSVGICF